MSDHAPNGTVVKAIAPDGTTTVITDWVGAIYDLVIGSERKPEPKSKEQAHRCAEGRHVRTGRTGRGSECAYCGAPMT